MASILEVIGRITLNRDGFDAAMASVNRTVDRFADQARSRLAKAFGVAAVISFARSIAATGKEIDELADKLGVTAEQAQKIRLREKLGGNEGKGNLLISDSELENLRVAERTTIKIFEIMKAGAAKLATNPLIGGTVGIVASVVKKTGFVSAEAPTAKRDETAREAHMATQDRIVQLEKEAKDINERAMFTRLTDEQQLNKLLNDRLKIQAALNTTGIITEEGEAIMKKKLAELNLSIAQEQGSMKHDLPRGGTPGIFIGAAANSNAGMTAAIVSNTQVLKEILKATKSGIVVRDVK